MEKAKKYIISYNQQKREMDPEILKIVLNIHLQNTYGHLNFNTKFLPFSITFPCFLTQKKNSRMSTVNVLQESQKLGNKNPIILLITTRKSLKLGT